LSHGRYQAQAGGQKINQAISLTQIFAAQNQPFGPIQRMWHRISFYHTELHLDLSIEFDYFDDRINSLMLILFNKYKMPPLRQ
jgi:hypothetical protein